MKTYVFMFKDTLQRFLWKNRPTVAGIFLDKARNAEAASLLDSTADMRGHGDTHRFTPGINRPPKGTEYPSEIGRLYQSVFGCELCNQKRYV